MRKRTLSSKREAFPIFPIEIVAVCTHIIFDLLNRLAIFSLFCFATTTMKMTAPIQQIIQRPRRGRVMFEDQEELFHIATRFEYSRMEICDLWFQRHELDEIKDKMWELSLEYQYFGEIVEAGECIRGLECRVPDSQAKIQRRRSKSAARRAVLDEQERQLKKQKMIDLDQIGEVYAQFTVDAQLRAYEIGQQDAMLQ